MTLYAFNCREFPLRAAPVTWPATYSKRLSPTQLLTDPQVLKIAEPFKPPGLIYFWRRRTKKRPRRTLWKVDESSGAGGRTNEGKTEILNALSYDALAL